MNASQIIPAIYDFLTSIVRFMWVRHRVVLDALFLAVTVTVAWMLWSDSSPDVVVYVGPRDSASARAGRDVVAELRRTESPSGVHYRVRMEYTTGFEDIRQRLENSVDGIAIGFLSEVENTQGDVDGKRGSLKALLPLDWDYLHVMCRIDFMRDIELKTGTIPKNLDEVLGYLEKKKHRVFLGPAGSNSAKLAEMVLGQYGVSIASNSAAGIVDWAGMRQAFKEDMIDVAFYCGPVGSKTIFTIADERTVALIGVGPIAEALALQQNMAIVPAKLPENLARAEVVPPVAVGGNPGEDTGEVKSLPPIPFSQKDMVTISVRRYLVCSSSLSTADAYLMAQGAKKALEGDYQIDFKLERPPYIHDVQTPPSRLRLHPGTKLLGDNQPLVLWRDPSTWPGWLQLAALGLALTLGIEVLRLGQRKLDEFAGLSSPGATPASPAATPASPTGDHVYLTLKHRIDSCEAELDQQSYVESDAKLGEWTERIRALRKEIRAVTVLTDEQREKLLGGVSSLQEDLMLLQRESSPTNKRSRAKVAPVAAASPTQQHLDRTRNPSATDDTVADPD